MLSSLRFFDSLKDQCEDTCHSLPQKKTIVFQNPVLSSASAADYRNFNSHVPGEILKQIRVFQHNGQSAVLVGKHSQTLYRDEGYVVHASDYLEDLQFFYVAVFWSCDLCAGKQYFEQDRCLNPPNRGPVKIVGFLSPPYFYRLALASNIQTSYTVADLF